MNLPNYFLADLPPEATLSPAMIHAACDTLKRNRDKYLLPRPTAAVVKTLCEVANDWLQPENVFRKLALELGPAETGFSRAVLEKGLDGFFRRFTPENFQALLEQELGHVQRLDEFTRDSITGEQRLTMVRGPEFLIHIAAGNASQNFLAS